MFLPEDYKAPSSSKNYMKIVDGENRFRILSAPILGWQDWKENKPMRFRFNNKPLSPVDANKPIRHFWAFIVFNYNDEMIQVLEITQATILKAIETLSKDTDWGAPYFYDIKIHKKGEKTDTEYTVNPAPKKPTDPYIIQEFHDKPCWLEALYEGNDPFDPAWTLRTPGVFSEQDALKKIPSSNGIQTISIEQLNRLREKLFEDNRTDEAQATLLKRCQCSTLEEITTDKYDKAFAWLADRVQKQKPMDDLPF